MLFKPGELAWVPEERPDLGCLLPPGVSPPQNLEGWLDRQVYLLRRLISESPKNDVEWREELLRDSQDFRLRNDLPSHPLLDPDGPKLLLKGEEDNSGSSLQQLKEDAAELLSRPVSLMPQAKARFELESLDLAQYVERVL